MNANINQFLNELIRATHVVERVVADRMTLSEFEEEYGNYYYTAALDGHEGSVPRDFGHRIDRAIHLHAAVQEILDRTYHALDSSNTEAFRSMGRITPSEAQIQLKRLPMHHDIPGILRELEGT